MAAATWRCFLVHVAVLHFLPVLQAANVASGKAVTMSSLAPHWNRAASLAVDENTNTDFYAGSCVATAEETDPWLRVDLGRNYLVKSVKLYLLSTDLFYVYIDQVDSGHNGVRLGNRKTFDECLALCRNDIGHNCRSFVRQTRHTHTTCWRVTTPRKELKGETYTMNKGKSLANLHISVAETAGAAGTVCHTETSSVQRDTPVTYACAQAIIGRYVTLKVSGSEKILALCEVQVDGVTPILPSSLTYQTVTSSRFTVRWGTCQDGVNTVYHVEYRKQGDSGWIARNATAERYEFTGLAHNTLYNVRVSCYRKDDAGLLHIFPGEYKEISVKTHCKDPEKVTITHVTSMLTGDQRNPVANVRLEWQHISDSQSGCDRITRYDVQYRLIRSSRWETLAPPVTISGSVVAYTITSFDFQKTYFVRVKSSNNGNKWSVGAQKEFTTIEGWSSAVLSLQLVTSAQSDSLSVSWQPPTHPRGLITGYKVSYQLRQRGTCSIVDGEWSDAKLVTSLYHNLTDLHPYIKYRVRVVPVNGAGDGVKATMDWRTAAIAPSSAPAGVRIKSQTARSMTFEWTAVSCEEINGVLIYYKYTLQGIEEYDNRTWTGKSYGATWTARDLVPYALYSFTVTTVNNAGSSAHSDDIRVRTNETMPLPPVDVSISDIRTDSLTVTWKTPTPPYGILQNYEIKHWTFNETSRTNITSGNETDFKLSSLQSVTNYSIQVRGSTGAGWGNWSDVIYGFTEEGVPGEPLAFVVTARSTDSAAFHWKEPRVKNGVITGYKVTCEYAGSDISHIKETNVLSDTVRDLSPGKMYRCFVTAKTYKGYGDKSEAIDVWTKPNKSSKPSQPEFKQMQATDTTLQFDLPSAQEGVTSYLMALDKEGGVSLKFRRKRQAVSDVSKLGKCTGDVNKDDAYITAELSPNQVGQAFTIGDNKTYGSYRNCPLQTGKLYDVYYGAVVKTEGGDRAVSFVKLQGAFKAKKPVLSGPDLAPILGVVAAVLLFIIIIVVVVILYRRRKHLNSHKRRPEVVVFKDLEPIIEKSKEEDKNAAAVVEVEEADVDEEAADADLPEDVYENTLQPNERAIAVDFIPQHIKMNSKNENKGFQIEYKSCQKVLQQQREVGSKPENKNKNRFVNIMAYDHTRVVLDFVEGDPHSDYINACFISGYKSPKKFIASQGPTKYMTEDFWRMLWQYSIKRVVMVTNLVEKGIRKCEKYWPERGSVERFDDIDVQLTEETVYSDFTVRTLKASKDGKSKIVWQFHYTVWPDHGVPQNAASLLNFRRKVKSYDQISKGPIVVHCSAGVGRTGTFIATDILLEEAKAEQHVNFWACLKDMREQRVNMIQTLDQYIFVHTAVNEGIQAQECVYTPQEFSAAYRSLIAKDKNTNTTKLSQQFKRLEVMSKKLRSKQRMSTINVANENSEKNRSPDIIPGAGCRPYLTSMVDARSDYINAVFIDGYKQKDAYIVTQMPLPDTIVDLWRLLLDHKSSTVVMLNQIDHEDQTCQPYWPTDNSTPRHFPPFTVEHVTTDERNTDFVVRTVKLTHKTKLKETSKDMKIFQLVTWPEADATPSSTWSFLSLMDHVAEWQQQLPEKSPITVHCYDGARKSGLFVLASYVLEKLKLEQEIDVFNAARQIQVNRPQFLAYEEQYRFCHTLLRDYLDSMSTYANFQ